MVRELRSLAVAGSLLCGACVCGAGDGTEQFACHTDSDCSSGYHCDAAGTCAVGSGGSGGGDAAGGVDVSATINAAHGGRGSVVELAGRPRVMFGGNGTGSGMIYAECTAACDGPSQVWGSLQFAGTSINGPTNRPGVAAVGSTVA